MGTLSPARILFSVFILFIFSQPPALADMVRLKNGRTLEGVVAEETAQSTTLEAGGGSLKIPSPDIEWVVKGSSETIEKKARVGQLFKKAEKYLSEKQFHEASSALKEASELEPGSYQIWNNLGTAYANDMEYNKASLAFQQAHKLRPGDLGLLENLANAHAATGQYQESWKIYHQLLKNSTHPGELYLKLSIVFYKARLYTQYKKFYQLARRLGVVQELLLEVK